MHLCFPCDLKGQSQDSYKGPWAQNKCQPLKGEHLSDLGCFLRRGAVSVENPFASWMSFIFLSVYDCWLICKYFGITKSVSEVILLPCKNNGCNGSICSTLSCIDYRFNNWLIALLIFYLHMRYVSLNILWAEMNNGIQNQMLLSGVLWNIEATSFFFEICSFSNCLVKYIATAISLQCNFNLQACDRRLWAEIMDWILGGLCKINVWFL